MEAQQGEYVRMKLTVKLVRKDSGLWHAYCPSLPGCIAVARDEREAGEKITRAIEGYIASFDAVPREITPQMVG
jgi:predicted RNase H-like HicB family nuclease